MFSFGSISLSILFGFLPPLIWLSLWLQEDTDHPEPNIAILRTFFLGSAAVIAALIIEGILQVFLEHNVLLLFFSWAIVEEGLKLIAVLLAIKLFSAPIDEPIDWIIYMITAALGFAGLENTLFLIEPFTNAFIMEGLVVTNLRFMGAMVLHLVASAAHGAALALCFYRREEMKRRYYVLGFSVAVVVHLAFNYILITGEQSTLSAVSVFAGVWLLLLPLILIFEKVKTIKNR